MSFLIVCGLCSNPVNAARDGGAVLSCGDFLCAACVASQGDRPSTCAACGKQGVRSAPLNNSLPEEVRQNISDTTQEVENLHNILSFQIKYYKQTIKRLLSKIDQLDQQTRSYQMRIQELENANNRPPQRPKGRSFFGSEATELNGNSHEAPSPHSSDGNNKRTNRYSEPQGYATAHYEGHVEAAGFPSKASMPSRPSSGGGDYAANRKHSTYPYRSDSSRKTRSETAEITDDSSSVGSQDNNSSKYWASKPNAAYKQPAQQYASMPQRAQQANGRIRSPHSPIVRSPLLHPLPAKMPTIAREPLPQGSRSAVKSMSPISSFIQHSFK